ncbi:cell division cycle-associated protein 3, partial [Carcharodon carcharias]|uniref:cell division cycle-associated protein 3 n=1 Tax=Carcharodon carcharias TaxID=13397 RepID=UPI001B7EB5A5
MMGTSGSTCVETPVRVAYNRHLSNALDPRSPSTGILRTPIEVLSSPSPGVPEADSEEEVDMEKPSGPLDPRSPTPGVTRTPLKLTVTDKLSQLVRQLSGVFISQEPEGEASEGGGEEEEEEEEGSDASELPVDELLDCEEEEDGQAEEMGVPLASEPKADPTKETPPTPKGLAAAAVAAAEGTPQQGCSHPRSLLPQPGPQVTKWKQAKAALLPGTRRSPLRLLRDDNSPSSVLARRQ